MSVNRCSVSVIPTIWLHKFKMHNSPLREFIKDMADTIAPLSEAIYHKHSKIQGQMCLSNQGRYKPDCFEGFVRICRVCLSVYIPLTYYRIVKSDISFFLTNTVTDIRILDIPDFFFQNFHSSILLLTTYKDIGKAN